MPDPDFKKRRGPGHPNLEITGRPGMQKKSLFERCRGWEGGGGGGRRARAPSLDPPLILYIHKREAIHVTSHFIKFLDFFPFNYVVHEKSQNK